MNFCEHGAYADLCITCVPVYSRPSSEPSDSMNFRHPSVCDCDVCDQ